MGIKGTSGGRKVQVKIEAKKVASVKLVEGNDEEVKQMNRERYKMERRQS